MNRERPERSAVSGTPLDPLWSTIMLIGSQVRIHTQVIRKKSQALHYSVKKIAKIIFSKELPGIAGMQSCGSITILV